MPPEKGMRFWLPSTVNVPGFPPYRSEDPWEGVKKTGMASATSKVTFMNCPDEGSAPLVIHGEKWIDNGDIIRHLLFKSKNGLLRFDPQEAVDKGYISFEEMSEKGFKVVKPAEPVEIKPAKKPSKKKSGIDLNTMTKDELVKFAGKKKLVVDVTLNKPELLKEVKAAMKEQENEE